MSEVTFSKILSANDTGLTGGHQAGILVPKGDRELLAFFPALDPSLVNPDTWLDVTDQDGELRRLRWVHYNKKLHGTGTRNEYRITYLTRYLSAAHPGDALVFSGAPGSGRYRIRLDRAAVAEAGPPGVIALSGWRRGH